MRNSASHLPRRCHLTSLFGLFSETIGLLKRLELLPYGSDHFQMMFLFLNARENKKAFKIYNTWLRDIWLYFCLSSCSKNIQVMHKEHLTGIVLPGTGQVLRNVGSTVTSRMAPTAGSDLCKGDLPFPFGSWALPSFSLWCCTLGMEVVVSLQTSEFSSET